MKPMALLLLVLLQATESRSAPASQAVSPKKADCGSFCETIRACAGRVGRAKQGELLCRIARCETGDKCIERIDSRNGLYHGPFQYSDATWRSQCEPFFLRRGITECQSESAVYDTCCAAMCSAEVVAKEGARNWPACSREKKKKTKRRARP